MLALRAGVPHSSWLVAVLLLVSLALAAPSSAADEKGDNGDVLSRREYQKIAREYGFTVNKHPKLDSRVRGRALSSAELNAEATRFFTVLAVLPVDFVRKSQLKRVGILADLELEGIPCGGVASEDIIILRAGFRPHVVYHEIFHVFDPSRKNRKWTKLNPKGFIYSGSSFFSAGLSSGQKKRVRKNLADPELQKCFVSDYARSFEFEDRAETFAYMVADGPLFQRLAQNSPVLRAKRDFIIDLTEGKKLLDDSFWNNRFSAKKSPIPERMVLSE